MISSPLAAALARRNIHYGWVVVGVTFLTMLVTAGAMGAPGVLIVPLEHEFGWDNAQISSALALRLLLYGLFGPFAAAFMNRFGLRRVVICAAVLIAGGLLASLAMTQVWQLVALWGIVVGIGTGLTAIDTLISASIRWPDIELIAVSRHGLVPFVHPELPIEPFPLQAELNARLLACEGPAAVLAQIRRTFDAHQDIDWRSVIDGMRPINTRLWQSFTPRQRKQFLHHARWLWESARHRFAPESAQIIQQLRDEGRLQIHAARVLEVDGDGPLNVTVRSRANQVVTTLQSDVVVQATGLDTAVAFAEHPLLAGLLESGLAIADPLQLGVLAEPDGRLINAAGDVQPGLYAIGSLLRGNLWECTAMPEIRVAADDLANRLSLPRATHAAASTLPA
jgi:uncharacterized NAD(P)/FAD-binding protein YdhS